MKYLSKFLSIVAIASLVAGTFSSLASATLVYANNGLQTSASPSTGTLAAGESMDVTFSDPSGTTDAVADLCLVNGVDVTGTFANVSPGLYKATYTVGAGDTARAAGMVPIDCTLHQAVSIHVTAFDDGNTVAIDPVPSAGGDTGGAGTTTPPTSGDSGTGTTTPPAMTTNGDASQNGGLTASAVPNTGTLTVGQSLDVRFGDPSGTTDAAADTCLVNGVETKDTFANVSPGLYKVTYTVGSGDADRAAGTLPVDCTLHQAASVHVVTFTDSNTVAIDASSAGGTGGAGGGTSSGPVAPSLAEASISPRTGTLTAGDIAEATFREANSQSDLTLTGACKVNAVDVSSSFQNLGGGLYKVAYTVGEGDGERPAGHIPLTCTLGNSAGDMAAHAWTDSNVLSIDTNNDGSIDNGTSTLGFTVVAEPGSGILHVGDALHVSMQDPLPSGDVVVSSNGCRVNGTDVSSSYAYHGDGLYSVDYTVGATDASRDAGTIPFDCGLQNATGSVHLTYFTDGNTVAIDVSTSTPSGEEGGSTGGTGTTTPSTGGDTGGTATSTGSLVTAVGIVPASGTIAAGRTTDVYFNAANGAQDLALGGACRVNDVDVSSSFQNLSGGLYKVTYTVGANDAERAEGMVPISCAFQNGAGATSTVSAFTDNNALAIDTNDDGAITEPTGNDVAFMSSVSAVPNTGTLDAGDSLEVYMQEGNHDAGFTVGACTVNGVDVSSTFVDQGNGLYKVTYTVGAGDADRSAGAIPVDCELHGNGAQSGQTIGTFFGFTDSNTVAINITGGTGTTTPPTGGDTGGNTGGVTTPAILWASITPGSGILHQDDSAQVYFQESHNMTDLSIDGACTVNGVSASLDTLDSGLYRLNYTVGVSDADRTAGAIPVSCFLKNGGGATTTIDSLAENTLAIQVSDSNSTTTGDVGGGVDGGQDAPLAVTSIDQVSGTATAGGGYEHGWAWVFHITVPNAETSLSMKFGDWTHSDGTHAIDAAGNMRISSAQASSSSSVTISAAGDYSEALDLSADLDPHAPGRQIEVRVEMQVPAGAVNGSYATSYGVKSLE